MNEIIKGIGLFLLISVSAFAGVFCALWLWSYVSIVYIKELQNKFKMKQNEKRKED